LSVVDEAVDVEGAPAVSGPGFRVETGGVAGGVFVGTDRDGIGDFGAMVRGWREW